MSKIESAAGASPRKPVDPMKDGPVATLKDVIKEAADDTSATQAPKPGQPITSVRVELSFPVTNPLTNELVSALTIRRLKTKDLRKVNVTPDDDPMLAGVKVLAALCEEDVDADLIDELDAEDFAKLQQAMNTVFPQGLPTLAQKI